VTAALVAVAGVCSAGALAASSGPTGNEAAIKFFERSQSAMAGYEGILFSGGPASIKILPQKGYDLFQVFTGGSPPSGYSRAVDDVLVVQHDGLVAEEVDRLSAPGKPAIDQWQGAKGEAVAEVLDSSPCGFSLTAGDHYVVVGSGFFGASFSGYRFAALKKETGGAEVVSATFAAGSGTADQTVTVDASNDLVEAFSIIVHGGPDNGFGLSETDFRYSRTQAFENPPSTLKKCP
jgi:hypothetical protein